MRYGRTYSGYIFQMLAVMFFVISPGLVSAQDNNTPGVNSLGSKMTYPMGQSLNQTLDQASFARAKQTYDKLTDQGKPQAKPAPVPGIIMGPNTRFIVDNQVASSSSASKAKPNASTSTAPLKFVKDAKQKIKLNFRDADIKVVVDFMANLFGLIPMVDSGLTSRVTFQTPGKVSLGKAYSILTTVIDSLNYAVICTDDGYMRIVAKNNAVHFPLRIFYGNNPEMLPSSDETITCLVPCSNISAAELSTYIRPLLSSNTGPDNLKADTASNVLIVSDVSSNIQRILRLIHFLDVPERQQFNNLETAVYYVNYLKAGSLATTLSRAFNIKSSVDIKNNNVVNNQVIIQSFSDCNALLVTARPDLQKVVQATIKKLDKRKRQVLLKVKFLEATYDRNFGLGSDLVLKAGSSTFQQGPNSNPATSLFPDTNPQLTYMFSSQNIDFSIQTLLTKNKVKLLSQPHLLTCDNESAFLTIGEKKPILKSTTDMTQSNEGNVVSDYSYINVGINLKITPHINPEKDVTMDMDFSISSIQGEDQFPGNVTVPRLSNREASTTVTVMHNHTLVIGGIISQNHTDTQNSIPWFGDIPVIGWLFGNDSEDRAQTELIILVTPVVVETSSQGDKLTGEEKQKIHVNQKDFEDFKKYFFDDKEKDKK